VIKDNRDGEKNLEVFYNNRFKAAVRAKKTSWFACILRGQTGGKPADQGLFQ
jgi:hypothetical protein